MRDGEKVVKSRLSSVCTEFIILDKVLPFIKKPFSLFSKHVLQTTETLLREVLTENTFYDRDSHTTPTFVKNGYVEEGYVLSLNHYDLERRCITEPDA